MSEVFPGFRGEPLKDPAVVVDFSSEMECREGNQSWKSQCNLHKLAPARIFWIEGIGPTVINGKSTSRDD